MSTPPEPETFASLRFLTRQCIDDGGLLYFDRAQQGELKGLLAVVDAAPLPTAPEPTPEQRCTICGLSEKAIAHREANVKVGHAFTPTAPEVGTPGLGELLDDLADAIAKGSFYGTPLFQGKVKAARTAIEAHVSKLEGERDTARRVHARIALMVKAGPMEPASDAVERFVRESAAALAQVEGEREAALRDLTLYEKAEKRLCPKGMTFEEAVPTLLHLVEQMEERLQAQGVTIDSFSFMVQTAEARVAALTESAARQGARVAEMEGALTKIEDDLSNTIFVPADSEAAAHLHGAIEDARTALRAALGSHTGGARQS